VVYTTAPAVMPVPQAIPTPLMMQQTTATVSTVPPAQQPGIHSILNLTFVSFCFSLSIFLPNLSLL
jgi:hypothetical protein